MSETYARDDAEVQRVESEENPSDIGTKPLDANTMQGHLEYAGIMTPEEWKRSEKN